MAETTLAQDQNANGISLRSVAFPLAIVVMIAVLIAPVPPLGLDIGLTISLFVSFLTLMIALKVPRPLDFSSFPVVLLIATMIRLTLNLASTRLILSEGHTGTGAAGNIIQAFATFVMQGQFLIGVIVFGILVTVNFVVINKGATRIAEVTARFTLDSGPGKQMAIDADLSSGAIDEQEARRRRDELQAENAFYGNMDGASKFVRGDAIAGLVIVFINAIGGILVGASQHGMSIAQAAETYLTLTVGDGLVTQIPALIVSTAAGMLVSKGSSRGQIESALAREMGGYAQAFYMVGLLFFILAWIPGLPTLMFLFCAAASVATGYIVNRRQETEQAEAEAQEEEAQKPEPQEERPQDWLGVDDLAIHLGESLAPLMTDPDNPESPQSSSKLGERLKAMRWNMTSLYGFVLPNVRLKYKASLPKETYEIWIQGVKIANGSLDRTRYLAISNPGQPPEVEGYETTEPAFGLPAKWIDEDQYTEAEDLGYHIAEPVAVLATHFHEIVKRYMADLLTYDGTKDLLDNAPSSRRQVIDDLVPSYVSISLVHKVLTNLLAEGIAINNLPLIVEAIGEAAARGAPEWEIVEHVRTKLARQICKGIAGEDNQIVALQLSRNWQEQFASNIEQGQLQLNPNQSLEFAKTVSQAIQNQLDNGVQPVILTSKSIRPFVRGIVARVSSDTPVLAHEELVSDVGVNVIGEV